MNPVTDGLRAFLARPHPAAPAPAPGRAERVSGILAQAAREGYDPATIEYVAIELAASGAIVRSKRGARLFLAPIMRAIAQKGAR